MRKLFMVILSGFCVLSFAFLWYKDIQVAAWEPLIWCSIVFFTDLIDYLEQNT